MQPDDSIADLALSLRTEQDLDPLLERVGDAKVVPLGEASHGTREFYEWRAAITRRLIAERDFAFVAIEADWPDCYGVNRSVAEHHVGRRRRRRRRQARGSRSRCHYPTRGEAADALVQRPRADGTAGCTGAGRLGRRPRRRPRRPPRGRPRRRIAAGHFRPFPCSALLDPCVQEQGAAPESSAGGRRTGRRYRRPGGRRAAPEAPAALELISQAVDQLVALYPVTAEDITPIVEAKVIAHTDIGLADLLRLVAEVALGPCGHGLSNYGKNNGFCLVCYGCERGWTAGQHPGSLGESA